MDLDQAQRVGHLVAPLPPDMRDDTAFMDRLHAYAPGWEFPKLDPRRHLTDHFGLVSDFLSESFTRLRTTSRANVLDGRIHFGGALSGRDIEAARKSVSGLIKLLYPNPLVTVPDADLDWIVRLALESRRRVKEQQRRVFKSVFRNTHFSYTLGPEGVETFVATPDRRLLPRLNYPAPRIEMFPKGPAESAHAFSEVTRRGVAGGPRTHKGHGTAAPWTFT